MSTILCSEALRTIGQDFELRGIKTFLVRCEADLYVVEAGYQSPPAATPVTLHYPLNDIEQLNREAQKRNVHDSAVKDFLSLSEILWTVGTYVTSKGARLLSVSNKTSTDRMPVIGIEYETSQGDRVIDDRTGSRQDDRIPAMKKSRAGGRTQGMRYYLGPCCRRDRERRTLKKTEETCKSTLAWNAN